MVVGPRRNDDFPNGIHGERPAGRSLSFELTGSGWPVAGIWGRKIGRQPIDTLILYHRPTEQ